MNKQRKLFFTLTGLFLVIIALVFFVGNHIDKREEVAAKKAEIEDSLKLEKAFPKILAFATQMGDTFSTTVDTTFRIKDLYFFLPKSSRGANKNDTASVVLSGTFDHYDNGHKLRVCINVQSGKFAASDSSEATLDKTTGKWVFAPSRNGIISSRHDLMLVGCLIVGVKAIQKYGDGWGEKMREAGLGS